MSRTNYRLSLTIAMPVLADILALLVMIGWMPTLKRNLGKPSGWNALVLVSFYLLFCLGVYLIRKLQVLEEVHGWRPPAFLLKHTTRVILAFFFGLLMMSTLAYQIGYFQSVLSVDSTTLDEGNTSALLVYMPGALLGFSMLYILVLAFPVNSNVQPESKRFLITSLSGLILANGMLSFTAAQAKAILGNLDLTGSLLIFLFVFGALLISFAPPRLLYQNKQPRSYSVISFFFLLTVASWWVIA